MTSLPHPRPTPNHRAQPLFLLLVWLSLCVLLLPRTAWADPVEAEKAFTVTHQLIGNDSVELQFKIRKDYYLYGEKFRFSSPTPDVTLGEAQRPPGKVHQDQFFGDVETYRNAVNILLPFTVANGAQAFELKVRSQGCWDGGICYPPQDHIVHVDLAAPPSNASLLTRLFDAPADKTDTTTSAALNTPAGANTGNTAESGDESGRIARMLQHASLPLVLVSFFGFGLLLAFTPCTFPMIPILSGIIVGQGHKISRGRAFVLSLAYVLGMAVTYALAGIAAGLSGTLLSAALQNVWVLGAFALLFIVLALSMFGFYELQLPTALQSRLSNRASHLRGGQLGGVALMGALSALIVGPCVAAPLAGALLYIARSGDAVLGGVALFVMALGMGAPLIAVGVATRSVLPRIGPWMEGVRKAFGVMLLGVALWLLMPLLPPLLGMLGWAALLIFSGIFLRALDPLPQHAHNWQRFWKGAGVALLLAGGAILVGALAGSRDPLQPLTVFQAQAASQPQPVFERVHSLAELEARIAASDRPVMLDFYADWCVSCKEMERYTFPDAQVTSQMAEMLLLKADVTDNTPDDKALLQRFELFGPPGIIFFGPDGAERQDLRVIGFMRAEPFAGILERARQTVSSR